MDPEKAGGHAPAKSEQPKQHDGESATPHGFRATLRPRELAVTLRSLPYRLSGLTGSVTVSGNDVTLKDVTARHGDAKIALAGSGKLGSRAVWELTVDGSDVPVDDDLRRALPTTLSELATALKLEGKIGFQASTLRYRAGAPRPTKADADAAATMRPETAVSASSESEPEIDLAADLTLAGASLDVGMPLADVTGKVALDTRVREGRLESLRGTIDFDSMTLAGRDMTDFRCGLFKPEGRSELRFDRMQGTLAGGELAGNVRITYPDDGPSRYGLDLVLREADVKSLTQEKAEDLQGKLTASLAL